MSYDQCQSVRPSGGPGVPEWGPGKKGTGAGDTKKGGSDSPPAPSERHERGLVPKRVSRRLKTETSKQIGPFRVGGENKTK